MAGHTKKTPELHDRMIALHKDGKSANEIGSALGVAHTTIANWLRAAGLEPAGLGGRKPSGSKEVRTPDEQAAALAAAEAESAILRPTEGVREALDIARRRHAEIARALDQNYPKFLAGSFGAPLYRQLLQLEHQLALQIRELIPPEPPDPERDPVNLDAAAAVHRRLLEYVSEGEQDLACVNCGKHPYRKAG